MAQATQVHERMRVVGSCGNQLGVVDHVEGDEIKLTRRDSPDNTHHFIPLSWVRETDDVDNTVLLDRDCGQAKREWR